MDDYIKCAYSLYFSMVLALQYSLLGYLIFLFGWFAFFLFGYQIYINLLKSLPLARSDTHTSVAECYTITY